MTNLTNGRQPVEMSFHESATSDGSSSHPRRLLVAGKSSHHAGAVFVGLALVTLGLVFVASFPLGSRSLAVQVQELVLILYTSVRAACCIRPVRPRVVTLIAWLWTYTLFGPIQVVQLSRGINPFHIPAPDQDMSRQLAVVLVGLVTMDLISSRAKAGQTKPQSERRRLSLRRTTLASAMTVAATPFLVVWLGGVSTLFGSRLAVGLALSPTGQTPATTALILVAAANVAPFFCAFALWRLRQAGAYTFKKRPDLAALFGLLLLSNLLLNSPVSIPRFWLATMVIALAVAGKRLQSIKFQVALVAIYVVTSVVIFPYLDVTRYASLGEATIADPSLVDTYLNKLDYGTAQDVTNAITYVDDDGHTDGGQLLGAALFFVPRSVWSEKPYDTARLISFHIGSTNTNLDSALWAEGYVDFGVPGVILVLGAFGFVIGRADRAYIGGVNPLSVMSTLIPAFTGYELILLRGSLLQSMGRLAMMLLVAWLISTRPVRASRVD